MADDFGADGEEDPKATELNFFWALFAAPLGSLRLITEVVPPDMGLYRSRK